MLTRKSWQTIAKLGALTVIFFVVGIEGGAIPSEARVCHKDEYTGQKDCPRYEIAAAAAVSVAKLFNDNAGSIAAGAAIAVALFTLQLRWSTDKQARLTGTAVALARDEFSAAHRPWIAIRDCKLDGSIIVHEQSMLIPLIFDVENTGSVHADRFFMFGDGVAASELIGVADEIEKFITTVKNTKRGALPYEVIFPQEKTTHRSLFGAPNGTGDTHLAIGVAPFIIIYGAFFYESPLDKSLRYTTFSYALYIDPDFLVSDEEGSWPVIPPEKVKIYKYQFGWSAT